jgi:hypothetical protein
MLELLGGSRQRDPRGAGRAADWRAEMQLGDRREQTRRRLREAIRVARGRRWGGLHLVAEQAQQNRAAGLLAVDLHPATLKVLYFEQRVFDPFVKWLCDRVAEALEAAVLLPVAQVRLAGG